MQYPAAFHGGAVDGARQGVQACAQHAAHTSATGRTAGIQRGDLTQHPFGHAALGMRGRNAQTHVSGLPAGLCGEHSAGIISQDADGTNQVDPQCQGAADTFLDNVRRQSGASFGLHAGIRDFRFSQPPR